ncbi:FG-GAP repeat domain-containing protein [Planctobacterium marinum]|uniref:Uncharacterized protein n=1 Tax=Planctobacterium marinum TaxID=1631968 RepID=A0AA48I8P4_9ALTE|nr:hypothetical protein MACH26_35310 [Planctobacterium marinum]
MSRKLFHHLIFVVATLSTATSFAAELDFDGDGKADIVVRRQASFMQYIQNSSDQTIQRIKFGQHENDIPVSGDFDGDGTADVAVRRPSNQMWYILNSSNGEIQRVNFGKKAEDIPVPADYDGDGITDIAVRRPSNQMWYVLNSSNGEIQRFNFGKQAEDIPVPADYDGDGKADIAVRRPSNQMWYILNSSDGEIQRINFGKQAEDIPVPADYDGDGKADVAVRRPSNQYWYVLNSSDASIGRYHFGKQSEDTPIVADYDGDGKADIAVRRASNQYQYILRSSDGEIERHHFGKQSTDVPLAAPISTRMEMVSVAEIENLNPVIQVTKEHNVYSGSIILFEAEATDPEGTELSYLWEQLSGTAVNLFAPEEARFTLVMPSVTQDESLQFSITVTDADGGVTQEQVTVNLKADSNSFSVDMGDTLEINEGESAQLTPDITDPQNKFTSALWWSILTDYLEFESAESVNTRVTAKQVEQDSFLFAYLSLTDSNGFTYTSFKSLMILDSGDQSEDWEVNVTAPSDIELFEGDTAELVATADDPDNQINQVSWTQLSGVELELSATDQYGITITAPEVDADIDAILQVEVTDIDGNTASDTVNVRVKNWASEVVFNLQCVAPEPLSLEVNINEFSYTTESTTDFSAQGIADQFLYAGDFNGDQLTDLLVGGEDNNSLEPSALIFLQSNGDGSFSDVTSEFLESDVSMYAPKAATADFNGDGQVDFVIMDGGNLDRGQAPSGGYYGEPPVVLMSNEAGAYSVTTQLAESYLDSTGNDHIHSKGVTWGDIDGDGDIDIFVESGGGYDNIVGHFLLNDGSGNFTVDHDNRIPTDILHGGETYQYYWRYIYHKLEDMNGDGFPDLVMGRLKRINNNQEFNFNKIAYNDGTGYFKAHNVHNLPGVDWNDDYTYVKSLIVGDLNGDGAKDLVLAHERGNTDADPSAGNTGRYLQALISDCNGEFIDETDNYFADQSLTTEIYSFYGRNLNMPLPMIFADMNNDGLEDLIMAGSAYIDENSPYLYIRKADRTFEIQDPTLLQPQRYWGEKAYPIDLNGDGLLDMVHSDYTPGPDGVYGTGDEHSKLITTTVQSAQ